MYVRAKKLGRRFQTLAWWDPSVITHFSNLRLVRSCHLPFPVCKQR